MFFELLFMSCAEIGDASGWCVGRKDILGGGPSFRGVLNDVSYGFSGA